MNDQEMQDLEIFLRSSAPCVKTTDVMNERLLRHMRSASAYHCRRRRWTRRLIAVAAAIILLTTAGSLVFQAQQTSPPCYVGKAAPTTMEPLLPPHTEHKGVSYGITASEYEIVIADVTL